MGTQRGTLTRERIFRTAAELFALKGYHATGLAELGEAVGLGRGALYYHIGSKENLLYQISVRHVEQMVVFGEELLSARLSPEERFRRLSRRLMRIIAENLPELTVFFREVNSLTGVRREQLKTLRDRFERIWLAILSDGETAGVFRHADGITVRGILGMHNYSYLWLNAKGPLTPEEIADQFCDVLLHGIMKNGRESVIGAAP